VVTGFPCDHRSK